MEVVVGGKYRHFKGNEYKVLNIAKCSETLEKLVVYQDLNNEDNIWVRPYDMFIEKHDNKEYSQEYRFEYIGD